MRHTPRFVAAGTLAIVLGGGMTLATAPVALADDDCTGLLRCAGKDVGDTVRSATKGDVDGTVKHVGKTAGDATREAGKTVHRAAGGESKHDTDEPKSDPSTSQPPEGDQEHANGGTGASAHDQAAPGSSNHQRPGHGAHVKRGPRAKHGADAREQSDAGISSLALRQWREHSLPRGPGWPYAIDEAHAGFPSTAAMPRRGRAPAPRVASQEPTAGTHGTAQYLAADKRAATAPLGGTDEPPDSLVLLAAVLAAAAGAGYLAACRWRRGRAWG